LAGRFRGKRVILLRHISQGVLLVTGPFKINGVPLRRVNARYVIATSVKVDLKGIDEATVDKVASAGYFSREKSNRNKRGEEAFFKQAEKAGKPEVRFLNVPNLPFFRLRLLLKTCVLDEETIERSCERPEGH
jgi:large subunit ribosomal protein L6e